ncbi:hypothetical protein BU23DRAFT_533148 [Bimuria novae-zelandiae CBS 107.79]|uniref:Lysophospholipase A n=1 Tax=Bimuria novae-zelandiae CBS 107.79 TaxID=1447943 RepID=A0A6A5VJJ4_9PLEO|nr:hypothetical protein BU23DRAFT_533148 [Bimuria novae-zelandiae CBS 107.79]
MLLPLLLPLALASLTTTSPAPLAPKTVHPFNWASTKHLIAFGDSYTFVQGTTGHPNYSFIGDNLAPAFTPQQLLSNRIVQNLTGTAEGGPNWIELLTNCGAREGLTSPLRCARQLWDFAYAGANTLEDASFTPLHHAHTVSLTAQIAQFKSYGDPALTQSGVIRQGKKGSDVLVALWIGINDINDLASLRGRNATFAPLYERVQSRQFELVEQLYDLGYRHFLFLNLPPLDRGPSPNVNASMVSTFNDILKEHADEWQAQHMDASVLLFDVNTVLNGVLDEYEKYGFTNVTGYCAAYNQPDIRTDPGKYGCKPLREYFWYNSGHLTSRTHEIFTASLLEFLKGRSRA